MKYRFFPLLVVVLLSTMFLSSVQAQATCSQNGTNTQMDLLVPNMTNQTLNVYWKDFQCVEQLTDTIPPGGIFYQVTFDGHEWTFRDPSGAEVHSFTAQSGTPTVVIGNVPFNPQPVSSNCSSAGTNTAIDLTIINNTDDPALLYWIDFTCVELFYDVIRPRDQYIQPTFIGHDWLVRYPDGKVVEQVAVSQAQNTVIINPPPTSQPSQTNPTATPQTSQPVQNPTVAPQTSNTLPSGEDMLMTEQWLNNQIELAQMRPDGTNMVVLNQVGSSARFSPDGKQVVFYSEREGDEEIFIVDVDGSNLKQITDNTEHDFHPGFSPDGRQIVFSSMRDGNNEIYIMNSDGSNQQRITNSSEDDRGPQFSPDGTKIVFHKGSTGNYNLYLMNVDGSNVQALTNNSASNAIGRFSPDGRQIVFQSNRDGNYEIYVMNSDGSNQQRLTNNPLDDVQAFFSPDGRQILYTNYDPNNVTTTYIMNTDGSDLRILLDGLTTDWFSDPSASTGSQASTTNTVSPTSAPAVTSSQFTGPAVQFLWNTDSFYMYNPGETLKIVSIRFEELDSNGQSTGVFFEGSRWAGIYDSVQRNFCNEIEISGKTSYLNPGVCQGVNARIGPSPADPVIFWNNASIRVLWDGTEIGRCPVSAGSCTLNLP